MKRPPGEEPLKFQRDVRHAPTEPERKLWSVLRNRQVADAKFRKQVWLGPFLVDFYCAAAKLVIEVDGDMHAHQQDYDARRTAWLECEGFQVIRFSNRNVMDDLEGIVASLTEMLDPVPHPPTASRRAPPSPLKGEGL